MPFQVDSRSVRSVFQANNFSSSLICVQALWDNRITQHIASWDYEGSEDRHGTRVTSLAEKPIFDPDAPSRREALGLDTPDAGQNGKGTYERTTA